MLFASRYIFHLRTPVLQAHLAHHFLEEVAAQLGVEPVLVLQGGAAHGEGEVQAGQQGHGEQQQQQQLGRPDQPIGMPPSGFGGPHSANLPPPQQQQQQHPAWGHGVGENSEDPDGDGEGDGPRWLRQGSNVSCTSGGPGAGGWWDAGGGADCALRYLHEQQQQLAARGRGDGPAGRQRRLSSTAGCTGVGAAAGRGLEPCDPPAALRNALLRCERELLEQVRGVEGEGARDRVERERVRVKH